MPRRGALFVHIREHSQTALVQPSSGSATFVAAVWLECLLNPRASRLRHIPWRSRRAFAGIFSCKSYTRTIAGVLRRSPRVISRRSSCKASGSLETIPAETSAPLPGPAGRPAPARRRTSRPVPSSRKKIEPPEEVRPGPLPRRVCTSAGSEGRGGADALKGVPEDGSITKSM